MPENVRCEWRCDPDTGVAFQVPVQITPQPSSQSQQSVSVQAASYLPQLPHQFSSAPHQVPAQGPQQADQWSQYHQLLSQTPQHVPQQTQLQNSYPTAAQDRLSGIIPLGEGATKKVTKVIDFARKCPVKWAKVTKPDNINLPLYSYGAVTEIEAALSGLGEPMSQAVLLAKIGHLKNTLEVCCLNSTSSDFSTYGWLIARDYAMKVEEEVEQRFVAWDTMDPGIRTHTLVLSQMEHPRAAVIRKKQTEFDDPKTTRKDRCTTFNSCTTEMKCDYEVANPGRTCQKKHECSWCRNNLQQGYKHQEWKCLKKQAASK